MNLNRFFCLLFIIAVACLQAPGLKAQNDRGPALNNVPALINNLSNTKPLKRQVEGTYSAVDFLKYDAVVDHVQGLARLSDGRYVFSHSTKPSQDKGLIAFSRPNQDAIFKSFGWDGYKQTHPSAMQACGNIVAVPIEDTICSIHFFDGTDPNNVIELTHLRITSFSNDSFVRLNDGIDAVGLVYSEAAHKHYLTLSKGSESGREDGPVWLFESNGLPLTDPDCRFTYNSGHRFFRTFTSASGYNLLYDASGDIYAASLYRTSPGGSERLRLTKYIIGDTVATEFISDILLSESGTDISPSPGFRWGGTIAINNANSIEVIGSARVLTGGAGANYCVIKIWKGEALLEDCRRYSDVSWLTSNKAYASPDAGYPAFNFQSLSLEDQLGAGIRAFTFDAWDRDNLNAPNAGPAYEAVKDAMLANRVYFMNDPKRLKSNGDCCEGGVLPGVNWPNNPDFNLPSSGFGISIEGIGDFLIHNPNEIVTLFLDGNASYAAFLKEFERQFGIDSTYLKLFMNQADYDNLQNRTLGEIRSSNRRLAVFHTGGTLDFNLKGYSFQFRDRFSMTVENATTTLPIGLNTCEKRDESAPLDTPNRLVVFNHRGQPFHELIARRWLDHCNDVAIPNFLVVNNVTDGSLGILPKDATKEFNRRINERMVGGTAVYRILVAGSSDNITQESDDADAKALISDNFAAWEFILNSDRSYFIRLKGTNRYLSAPVGILGTCQMKTDTDDDRTRWYVEPLNGGTVRLFSKHEYSGVRKAMRLANDNTIKLSDNIDFVNVADQKFELLPVISLGATCKSATLVLDQNGSASLQPEDIKAQINYTGVCQEELFVTTDRDFFDCADVGTHQITLSVSNGAGLSSSCVATVTVTDNSLPSIECPASKIISANGNCAGTVGSWMPVSMEDNCMSSLSVTQIPSAITALNGHNDSRLVTLTANDGHGNSSQCSFSVTLKDNTAPVITCKNGTTHLDNTGIAVIGYGLVYQSGTDNCGTVNLESISKTLFNCANLGPNTVTVTVNDGNGNTGTCNAIVTVVDNIAPSVVCKPYTAYLNDVGVASIVPNDVYQSGSDNCSTVNLASVSPNAFSCANLGANTVLLTVNDGHGNNATCNTTVTVIDNLVPSVVCKTFTAYLNAAGVVSVTPADVFQSGTDNCGVVNLVAVSPSNFNCTKLGSNDVTLVVNDGHGNSNSCNTYVIVKDAIIPTMLCKNATLYLNSAGQANLQLAQVENGSFDNCGITFMGLSQTLFTCDHLGANTVVLGGRDQSQNKGQCTATITVLDTIRPVTKCKNLAANLDANGLLKVTTATINNGSFDNCSFTQTLTPSTFSCGNIGLNNAVLRSTDASGNTSICTTVITIKDLTAPTAICKNATIYVNDGGQATLNTSQIDNNSTDACGIASMNLSKTQFNCSDIPGSSQTVTLSIKDVNNNQSTCTAQVTTKDNLAPTAVCNNVTVQLGENGKVTVSGAVLGANSFDNCSVWSYSPIAKVYTSANLGPNNLTITVKDWSGNAATCVSVVTVEPQGNLKGNNDRNAVPVDFAFKVYPNPTSGDISVAFELPLEQQVRIRVYDLQGRLVLNQDKTGAEGNNTLQMHLGAFAPGGYILDFQSEGLKAQRRLIVQE